MSDLMTQNISENSIYGVLIEGVDYSGKTSVAKCLCNRLLSEGINARYQHGYLFRSCPINKFLTTQSIKADQSTIKDWFNTTSVLIDLLMFPVMQKELLTSFIIQDRQWLTALSRQKFYHKEIEFLTPNLIETSHIPFNHNVYLTCSIKEKRKRVKKRPASSLRDQFLIKNIELHQEFDEFIVSNLIPEDERWLVIDTSGLTIRSVVDQIRKFVGTAVGSHVHRAR